MPSRGSARKLAPERPGEDTPRPGIDTPIAQALSHRGLVGRAVAVGFRAAENVAIGTPTPTPEARVYSSAQRWWPGRRLIQRSLRRPAPRAQAVERLAGDAITAPAVNRAVQPPTLPPLSRSCLVGAV
jgi:hypothetical protein